MIHVKADYVIASKEDPARINHHGFLHSCENSYAEQEALLRKELEKTSSKSKEIYIVGAILDHSIYLVEAFDDKEEALRYEKTGLKKQLINEYGLQAAESKDLATFFSIRNLHTT
jgi:hypothetical protein